MSTLLLPDDQIAEIGLQVPEGDILTYDMARLCSALGITDPTRLSIETDGGRNALLTLYPANPLAEIRAAAPADLIMDRHGRVTTGLYHSGRPVKTRLYDPRTGSAQRAMLFGTTGAGKSRAFQLRLAAEKRNRFANFVCDLKDGQSAPEAKGQVDWHGTMQEHAILMLRAGVGVIKDRSARYALLGRNSFLIDDPDPLLSIWIDEANRLLEKGAPYRDEATYLIKEIGRTGRSVGVGIGLAAQAAHLEELGGSDTLRAMLKEGEVTLLRWSGSMMKQLVSDGLLPANVQLAPIPRTLRGAVDLSSQFDSTFDSDEDDDPTTAGCGYHLSGPRPAALMRHLRVGSMTPLPGLDPEILALYGPEAPRQLEERSWEAAGTVYGDRNDPAKMAAHVAALQGKPVTFQAPAGATPSAAAEEGPVITLTRKAVLLEDRILAVLEAEAAKDEPAPLSAHDILARVNADGGREVKEGSVRNELTGLVHGGDILPHSHGLFVAATR